MRLCEARGGGAMHHRPMMAELVAEYGALHCLQGPVLSQAGLPCLPLSQPLNSLMLPTKTAPTSVALAIW
eukprot:12898150-Prorocentrum_lima.AAC.1